MSVSGISSVRPAFGSNTRSLRFGQTYPTIQALTDTYRRTFGGIVPSQVQILNHTENPKSYVSSSATYRLTPSAGVTYELSITNKKERHSTYDREFRITTYELTSPDGNKLTYQNCTLNGRPDNTQDRPEIRITDKEGRETYNCRNAGLPPYQRQGEAQGMQQFFTTLASRIGALEPRVESQISF